MKRQHTELESSATDSNGQQIQTITSISGTSRIISYKPPATAVSSALQSTSAINLLRTRSVGTTTPTEDDSTRHTQKKQRLATHTDDTTILKPSTRSPLQVTMQKDDDGEMSDDDFFSLMDPLSSNENTLPVSARVASSSFFRSLDEAKENNKALPTENEDTKFASLVFRSAPLDYNLHTKIRFTSHTSFDWMAQHSVEHESDGMHAFLAGCNAAERDGRCGCLEVSPLRELHHALFYCTFPATPFTKNHPLTGPFLKANAKPSDQLDHADHLAISYVNKIWIQWEDSFRSLYYRLFLPLSSPSSLEHFYTVHRSPFPYTVLFIGPDGEEDALPSAIISRSNRVLRTALQKAGVNFTMPNSARERTNSEVADGVAAPVNGTNVVGGATNMEVDEDSILAARLQARKDERQEKDEDLSAASVLVVQGRQDLHALYSFLLQQDRRELNVPTLLASSAFLNGTTQQLNIVRVGAQSRPGVASAKQDGNKITALKESSSSSSSNPTEYALDIVGPILPGSSVRLFNLLQKTQHSQFQAYLSSDFPGMNLNCVSTVLQMDSLRNQDSLALCLQSPLRTSAVSHLIGKQPVSTIGALKRVKCDSTTDGVKYVVELSTATH